MARTSMVTASIEELLRIATGDLPLSRKRFFRPSMFYTLTRDLFSLWCHYHAPKEAAVDESTRYDQVRLHRGANFENEWLNKNYPEARWVEPDYGIAALRATLEAMLGGAESIRAPQLWLLPEEVYGKADLLVRDDSKASRLGAYHYRVVEIKLAKNLSEYHILQTALYNHILGKVQGFTPAAFQVILAGEVTPIKQKSAAALLASKLELWRDIRDGHFIPDPIGPDKTLSPWRVYGNAVLEERRDLTLIADVGPDTRRLLVSKTDIRRVDDLYDRDKDSLAKTLRPKRAARLLGHAQAHKQNKPLLIPGKSYEVLRAERGLYFDFETSDWVHPSEPYHIYLIGVWDQQQGTFINFLGRGFQDEERIFNEFLDYVGDAKSAKLYHWSSYEVSEMRTLVKRHPRLKVRIGKLIKSCVDLKEAVKRNVYLPVSSYSIKKVAPFMGFSWRHKDVGALSSMAYYWDYLEDSDPQTIQKVLDYNEDDCKAMAHVDEKLDALFNGPVIPEPAKQVSGIQDQGTGLPPTRQ